MSHRVNRKIFLAGGASAALVACTGGNSSVTPTTPSTSPSPTPTVSPTRPPATAGSLIVDLTKTDLPSGTQAYVYIIGGVLPNGNSPLVPYWLDSSGLPHVMQTSDNTVPAGAYTPSGSPKNALSNYYPDKWAFYGISVLAGQSLSIPLTKITPANVNGLGTGTAAFSGRVYISVGPPVLPFTVQTVNGVLTYAAPSTVKGAVGSACLFDFMEFSVDSTLAFDGNTSQVDQFGFPFTMTSSGGSTQGGFTASRASILNMVTALPAPFGGSTLVIGVPSGAPALYPPGLSLIRAFSPSDYAANVPAANQSTDAIFTYFDATVKSWFTHWQGTPLKVTDAASGTFTGTVSGTTLSFTGAASFSIPSTGGYIPSLDIWQCANSLASGNAAQKNVEKVIAAAFNRGVVQDNLTDVSCSPPYYAAAQPFAGQTQLYNPWSELFHKVASNGLAYGFAYDDVCSQSTTMQFSLTTQALTITVGNFLS